MKREDSFKTLHYWESHCITGSHIALLGVTLHYWESHCITGSHIALLGVYLEHGPLLVNVTFQMTNKPLRELSAWSQQYTDQHQEIL